MSASLIKLFARVNLSNSSRALSCQAPVVTAAHKPFLSNRIEQEVRIESQGLLCQSFSTNCRKVDLGCFQPQLRSFSTGNVLCMERINRKKELKGLFYSVMFKTLTTTFGDIRTDPFDHYVLIKKFNPYMRGTFV